MLKEGKDELAVAAQSKLNSTNRLTDTYKQQFDRQQSEYQKLLDAKLKLEAKLTTVKQEREEMQALLDLARSKELTAKMTSQGGLLGGLAAVQRALRILARPVQRHQDEHQEQ